MFRRSPLHISLILTILLLLAVIPDTAYSQLTDPSNGADVVVPLRGLRARSGHGNYGMWGLETGLMSYRGELSHNQFYRQMRPCIGVSYTRRMVTRLYMRWGVMLGGIEGYDRLSNAPDQQTRNLSFKSSITEVHTALLYQFNDNHLRCNYRPENAPYVMAGVGLFHFNPKAQLGGEWYALQPLGTEGQFLPDSPAGRPYKRIQGNLMAGVGIHHKLNRLVNMRMEFAYRYLFTDYLDDVSTVYPDLNRLRADGQDLAFLLTDRRDRAAFGLAEPWSQRGDELRRDSYFTFTLALQKIPVRHAVIIEPLF